MRVWGTQWGRGDVGGHWGMEGDVAVGWEMMMWGSCQGLGDSDEDSDRDGRWGRGTEVGTGMGNGTGTG